MNKDAEEKEEEEEEGRGIRLLGELVSILDRDPLINEVGFVHPSQLATFHPLGGEDQIASFSGTVQKSTVGTRNISFSGTSKFPLSVEGDTKASRELSYDRSVFWNGDHKLAISVQALFPLYMTAKSAYLSAYQWYKRLVGSSQNEYHLPYVCEPEGSSETSEEDRHPLDIEGVENELMNHSKVLVLLNCDYASAWNSRKQVISRKPLKEVYCTELRLSALVISYAPKSEQAWSYRYWLIKLIISGVLNSKEVHLILESESDFVENIVERSHMNYRAWRHRCWLVNHMSKPQLLLLKLHQSSHHIGEVDRDISLNFFYTSFQNDTKGYEGELLLLSKEELDWNKNLITHNSGRETLWIHRRFLFLEMIQQAEVGFHCNHTLSATHCDIGVLKHGKSHQSVPFDLFLLMEQEFEFINSCINKHGTIFEDASKQKEYAAMYNMWIIFHLRQVNGSQAFIERVEKEKIKLKVLLENVCPQRTLLWEEVLSV